LIKCGKVHPFYLCVSTGDMCSGHPDFHAFLSNASFTMWIWLESDTIPGSSALLLTRISDLKPVCSQPVDAASPTSIAVCTISAACTGIDCYYCIYIDICFYILRRSKRQGFQQKAKGIGTRSGSVFLECPEVGALQGADTAHVMQARAHAISNAVTQCFLAGGRAGVIFFP
jgi:hypothetical protein